MDGFNTIGILLYAFPGLLSTIIFDRNRFGGELDHWIQIAFAGYAVAAVMYLLGGYVYRRLIPKIGEHPVWVQLYFGVIGGARAFVIYWLGTETKLIPASDWLFRLVGGPIFTGATLGIAVILGINFKRSAAEGLRLSAERIRLKQMQQTMRQKIETQRAELAGRVRGILAPALADVRSQLAQAAESRAVFDTLNHTVDEIVRPLSHSIARTDDEHGLDEESAIRARRWAISVLHRAPLRRLIVPQLSAILITVSTLPAAVAIRPGLGGFTMALVEGLCTLLGLYLLRVIFYRINLPLIFGTVVVIAGFGLNQLLVLRILHEIGLRVTASQEQDVFVFGLIFGGFIAVGQTVQTARGLAVLELQATTNSLALLISRLKQEIWLNNRRMASVLHGPVQAALYAAGMKLSSAKSISVELINEVEHDINAAFERLDYQHSLDNEDFAETINQIVSLWRGSCEISVFTSDDCSLALYRDRNAAACVVEVVQEAISNAIKHGRASNASVVISLLSPSLAEVRVRNDGHPVEVSPDGHDGLGSQILDEICHIWKIDNTPSGVVLVAQIALA